MNGKRKTSQVHRRPIQPKKVDDVFAFLKKTWRTNNMASWPHISREEREKATTSSFCKQTLADK
jgi:hypothetical protein